MSILGELGAWAAL